MNELFMFIVLKVPVTERDEDMLVEDPLLAKSLILNKGIENCEVVDFKVGNKVETAR